MDFEHFYAQRTASASAADGSLLVSAIDSKGIPMVKAELATRAVRLRKGEKRQKKRMYRRRGVHSGALTALARGGRGPPVCSG